MAIVRFDPRVLLVSAVLFGCEDSPLSPEEAAGPEFAVPAPPASGSITRLSPPTDLDDRKVALGKDLFNDVRLSRDGSVACANCHDIAAGGDDGRRVSVGIDGQEGLVNAPTVLNSALNVAQFWDGRAVSLEEQIVETVQSLTEMGGDWPTIEQRLRADKSLSPRFEAIYNSKPRSDLVADALAEYLGALITPDAPFDRYLAGDSDAIGAEERQGYELFTKLGCISCHQGRNVGGNFFQTLGVMENYFDSGELTAADLGRFNVTGRDEDRHKFKVPSLRNVADTAPYFHDGSAGTLEDAVRIMVKHQLGRPVADEQIAAIVAFLESLSGRIDESLL